MKRIIRWKTILTDCLCKYKISLRELAKILGNMFPDVTWPLHYRHLEKEKISGLQYQKINSKENK